MFDGLITLALQLLAIIPLLIFAGAKTKKIDRQYLTWALGFFIIDTIIVMYTKKFPSLPTQGLHWNWFGKSASTLFSVFFFLLYPNIRSPSGITWKQNPGSGKYVASLLLLLIGLGYAMRLFQPPPTMTMETFFFQLFLPSLDEEFLFRGVLLYLFSKAFADGTQQEWNITGIFLISVLFGIVHALVWKAGQINFSMFVFFEPFFIGLIFMALRIVSGSVLFAMVGHSIYNLLCS